MLSSTRRWATSTTGSTPPAGTGTPRVPVARSTSAVKAINWLGKSRGLFPASTLERLQADAVTRYGLDDLLVIVFPALFAL